MSKYEYMIYFMKYKSDEPASEQLLEKLNEMGKDGWRLHHIFGGSTQKNFNAWKGGQYILFEKEITEE